VINLSPFLYIGLIIKIVNLSGKTTENRDLLQICVKGEMIKEAVIFRDLIGISW
jgi:hypothetical protein